jgi:Holliday junction resolvase-like predicted endonuclease
VHPQQLQRIFDAGTFFLASYPQFDSYECQIDIIVVNKNIVTQHIKGQTLD